MEPQTTIATRSLIAIDTTGHEFTIHLGIGQPYEISPTTWACPVQLTGLHDNLLDQQGIDSWQALQLSTQLIIQLLIHFLESGGTLLWPTTRAPFHLHELSVGRTPQPDATQPASNTQPPNPDLTPPICPSCHNRLLSRLSPLCGTCGEKVPAHLLHDEATRLKIAIAEQERTEQLEAKRREIENTRKQRNNGIDINFGGFG
jgi:hypothetical protein